MLQPKSRRGFLETLAWGVTALGWKSRSLTADPSKADVPRRRLGRTGLEVSCVGYPAAGGPSGGERPVRAVQGESPVRRDHPEPAVAGLKRVLH